MELVGFSPVYVFLLVSFVGLVVLVVIIGIIVYIRKYKRDFLNNQVIVR